MLNAEKNKSEATDILMNYMSESAFDAIITPQIKENPKLIWDQIVLRYASQSINNKGWVWLKFMQFEYKGNLKEYLSESAKILNEISIFKLGVPDEVLSYSILAKLSQDLWNVVDNIIMNEELVKNPAKTLAKLQEMVYLDEARKEKKPSKESSHGTVHEEATALFKECEKKKKKTT